MRVVKSIRIREDLWENVRALSKEQDRYISDIIEESLEKYLAEQCSEKAVETLKRLPALSLGGETVTRKEIYEGRY